MWLLMTDDPLIQVHLHYILVHRAQKMWLLKAATFSGLCEPKNMTGDPLIEVTI